MRPAPPGPQIPCDLTGTDDVSEKGLGDAPTESPVTAGGTTEATLETGEQPEKDVTSGARVESLGPSPRGPSVPQRSRSPASRHGLEVRVLKSPCPSSTGLTRPRGTEGLTLVGAVPRPSEPSSPSKLLRPRSGVPSPRVSVSIRSLRGRGKGSSLTPGEEGDTL